MNLQYIKKVQFLKKVVLVDNFMQFEYEIGNHLQVFKPVS